VFFGPLVLTGWNVDVGATRAPRCYMRRPIGPDSVK
jgi:hypothetical protein